MKESLWDYVLRCLPLGCTELRRRERLRRGCEAWTSGLPTDGGEKEEGYLIKLNNCSITCANGDALSGAGATVKRAEEGDGAERRSGAATSEMRNAWGDVPGAMAARGEERR